jgi:cysteinyl-tRNA synthetase
MSRAAIPDDERRWLVLDADFVLGLDLDRAWTDAAPADLPPGADRLIAQRVAAREAGDYARADALRVELAELGVDVRDAPDGSSLARRVNR